MSEPRKKVIVAVHGIGDQIKYATPQQVLAQFCQYHGAVAAVPLGSFHNPGGMLTLTTDYPAALQDFVFTEVYWAGVPRDLVTKGHEIEGTQPWVRTLIGRVQRRAMTREDLSSRDFQMIEQVLKEMLDSISILDRVFYLTGRMGIFSFDLEKVLTDFLGDVQIVTEFKDSSREILKIFNDQMDTVHQQYSDADIYFVAHSEGTVVTLLGLLHAMCDPATPNSPANANSWLQNVRGLMTLGSPIDKHLNLWPELFTPFAKPLRHPKQPIEWRNYFDYGDPIGFELDEARKWFVDEPAWKGVFNFDKDRGFSRYPFPGKAHNDYWTDQKVFGHFIHDVVHKDDPPPPGPAVSVTPPTSRWWTPVVSWVGPYLALLAILFCAVFVLHKSAHAYYPECVKGVDALVGGDKAERPYYPECLKDVNAREVFGDVLGITLLVAGLTVMVRIPRLSRRWFWRLSGIGFFALSLLAFPVAACPVGDFQTCWASAIKVSFANPGLVGLSIVIAGVSWTLSLLWPTWGMRALLIPGTLATALYLGIFLNAAPAPHGDLWPVFLAGALFLYLWWLVALLFDLVFVWHRYIRRSGDLKYLRSAVLTSESAGSGHTAKPLLPLSPEASSPGPA
jgi:hypothetical protein